MCDEGGDAVAERRTVPYRKQDDADAILRYKDGGYLSDSEDPVQIKRLKDIGYLTMQMTISGR